MSVLFYRDVPSPLHRLDARAKVFGLAAILAAVVIHFHLLLLSLTLAALLLLTALARTFDRLWRFRALLVILTLFSLVIWSLSRPEGRPLGGRITQEGLFLGVATALKLNAMVVAAVLLIATTRMEDLSRALQKLKVPFRLCFVLTFALSLIPGLVATADAVIQAQRARGIDVGGRRGKRGGKGREGEGREGKEKGGGIYGESGGLTSSDGSGIMSRSSCRSSSSRFATSTIRRWPWKPRASARHGGGRSIGRATSAGGKWPCAWARRGGWG